MFRKSQKNCNSAHKKDWEGEREKNMKQEEKKGENCRTM
jgi:hypothetical protein